MAKITKQAQEILCQMIDEKATAKRNELEKDADKANEKKLLADWDDEQYTYIYQAGW